MSLLHIFPMPTHHYQCTYLYIQKLEFQQIHRAGKRVHPGLKSGIPFQINVILIFLNTSLMLLFMLLY